MLNQNLINTALPTLMAAFNVGATDVQWLVSGYTLANGMMVPITAYLVGRFSTRRVYFWAMGLFGAGTLLCAAAPIFGMLLVGRVVQALGAAICLTLVQTVLFMVFPADRRGAAMGLYGLVISFAPAFGPALAGFIVDSCPWQMLYVMQLPFLVVLMALAAFLVKNVTGGEKGSFDVPSVALSTLGFGGLLYGIGSIGALGITHPAVIVSLVVGAVCVALFVSRQLRLETPVLEFRTFAYPKFGSTLVLSVGTWALYIGTAVVLPLFMQTMLGFSATQSGLVLMGGGIMMGVMSLVMGRVFDARGPRRMVPAGLVVIIVAQVLLARAGEDVQMLYLAAAYIVLIVGLSMSYMPLSTTSISVLPQELIAHGSAMSNTMRQVVSATSAAVFVNIMSAVAGPGAQGAAQIPGAQAVFSILAVLAACVLVASFVVLRKTKPSRSGKK